MLAADHRWQWEEWCDARQIPRARIGEAKRVAYDGFLRARDRSPDVREFGALLVDAQYAAPVVADALTAGLDVGTPAEKAGAFPLAWSVRGWLDRLVGGVGLRRGRRHPYRLQVGDALDFWLVEEIVPGELLRLRAEMRLPGRAWLEMRAEPLGADRSRYHQRAVFLPRGLAGHGYWAIVAPFHALIFGGMARNISHAAERLAAAKIATREG